jgi:hypothetical protein
MYPTDFAKTIQMHVAESAEWRATADRNTAEIRIYLAEVARRQLAAEKRMDRAEARMDRAEARTGRAEGRMDRAEARMEKFDKRVEAIKKLIQFGMKLAAEIQHAQKRNEQGLDRLERLVYGSIKGRGNGHR